MIICGMKDCSHRIFFANRSDLIPHNSVYTGYILPVLYDPSESLNPPSQSSEADFTNSGYRKLSLPLRYIGFAIIVYR